MTELNEAHLRPLVAFVFTLFFGATEGRTEIQPGHFALKAGKTNVEVSSWGDHCGEKPKSQNLPLGRRYTLTDGQSLKPQAGAPPLFASGICKAATALPRIVEGRTRNGFNCKSPLTDATQVKGRVSWILQPPNQILVNHRFSYEWRLKGSHCKLSSSTEARLERRKAGVSDPAAKKCTDVESPAEIRIEGRRMRRLRNTRRTLLKALVVDAQGCPTQHTVTWSTDKGKLVGSNMLDLSELKVGEKAVASARFGSLEAQVKVTVASKSKSPTLTIPWPRAPRRETPIRPPPVSGWAISLFEVSVPRPVSMQFLGAGAAFFMAGLLIHLRRRR